MSRKFIIIILIAIALTAGGFAWKNQKESIKLQNNQKVLANISPAPAVWKVYENKKYNFSLQHPSDWTVNIYNQNGEYIHIGHDAAYIDLVNSEPFELGVPIIHTEVFNVGGEGVEFEYYNTTVSKGLVGYSYDNSRKPFNWISFTITSYNEDAELIIIKRILASYKALKN